jgi:hypothetical protein
VIITSTPDWAIFSPNDPWFTLDSFLKYRSSTIFGELLAFVKVKYYVIWTTNGWAKLWAILSRNSSGHSAPDKTLLSFFC